MGWQSEVSMTTKAHPLTRLNILSWFPFIMNLDFLIQMPNGLAIMMAIVCEDTQVLEG